MLLENRVVGKSGNEMSLALFLLLCSSVPSRLGLLECFESACICIASRFTVVFYRFNSHCLPGF